MSLKPGLCFSDATMARLRLGPHAVLEHSKFRIEGMRCSSTLLSHLGVIVAVSFYSFRVGGGAVNIGNLVRAAVFGDAAH